jgi:hypothetical protein
MTREEAILLVSRALACIQAIAALLDFSYLPEHMLSLHHYLQLAQTGSTTVAYWLSLERVEIAFYFGRIAILLLTTLIFWNCGPRIARFLLPEQASPPHAP